MVHAALERTFSRSSVDESVAANVIVEKYTDHLPLYRQTKRCERQGVVHSESTLGDIITACGKLLQPLYEAHRKAILS
jgi:transposase